MNKKISADLFSSVSSLEEFSRLSDTIVVHLPLKIEDKQEVLEISSVVKRMEKILEHIETELDIPVTSSNHALAWHCLRLAGIDDKQPELGRLFSL